MSNDRGDWKTRRQLDNFILTLKYSVIERMCINGDIDLIRPAIDPGQQLLWILEDSDSKTISFSRSVSAADLALDFTQAIKIPVTQEPRYYRLALCSSQSTRSCAGTQAFDFDKIQDTKVKQAVPVKNGLFFSQNLRIDATGLRLFDSREVGNAEDYILYASEADGNTKASKFISEMVEQKKLMRPLPAKLDKDGLHINLYVRNNKDCK
ncbi:MAG: hypothetical protein NTX25_19145 [Proteobacteria bacterium]|nr:hypothetical protein [Pseudomonadota bacterium]